MLISHLRSSGDGLKRAYRVRDYWKLPDTIPIRKGLSLQSATEKTGIRLEFLAAFGIEQTGINLPRLRAKLLLEIPEGSKLREKEELNMSNVISAIIGRLGEEEIVLEPKLNIVMNMRRTDLTTTQKAQILYGYLTENFVASDEIWVDICSRTLICGITEWFKIAQMLAITRFPSFGSKPGLYDGNSLSPLQKDFYARILEATNAVKEKTPSIGFFDFEDGAAKLFERITWLNGFPKLIALYGPPNAGKSFLADVLANLLNLSGVGSHPYGDGLVSEDIKDIRKQIMTQKRSEIPEVHIFHCAWDRPWYEDPHLWLAKQERDVDITVGLCRQRLRDPGFYDIAICNPDSYDKYQSGSLELSQRSSARMEQIVRNIFRWWQVGMERGSIYSMH